MKLLVPGITARGSFKRQIILAFVVGFFLLISAFSIHLVSTEKESLYRDSSEATTGLAQSLAVSSLSWVLANDVVGLQEVVRSFQGYPGLRYAMVISPTGRVLAHSDAAKVGQFVADPQSLALLKGPPGKRIVTDDATMADVALPISVEGRAVGWARVAVGREKISGDLNQMMWRNALFVLSATLLSLLAALLIAHRLGSRIGVLVKVAEEVRSGNMAMRVGIPAGADEITLLADNLNQMLNALARNEERLRAASLYTRSLIEASLDPLVTISAEGKITDVNQATENVTGRSRSELIGTDFCDYFTAPEQARESYRQVFQRGSVADYPLALRHRDGHITDVLYNASVYQGEKGEVLGVFAAARDITEQKRAQGARSRLAAIVESSSDAIIGKTLDGVITSWNKGAEKIYGYRADEIIGKPITMLAPPSLHAEVDALLEKVRQGEAVVNHETERVRKDGTRFHVALTLSPIRDDAGHIGGISTIARDITERKLDEAALHRLNRELRAISSCNQTLMRAEDEATLLKEICDIVCDEAGYRMAWVGYAEIDAAKSVRAVAWAGVEEGYLAQAGITWADTDRGRGPAGSTIRSGRSTCLQDFGTDPRGAPWHDGALQRGYRSCISLPLKDESQNTFGVFTIYSSELGAFTRREVRLLEELAGDLAFGIAVLRTRNERQRVEAVLRKSEKDLKDAQRVAHTGSWDWDAKTDSITWSEEYYRIYGFDPAQPAPGYEAHLKAYTPESAARLDAAVKRNMETGEPYQLDLELVRPAGESRWITARSETRRDAQGQVIGLRGTAQDITERKQAEEQLRRSEHRLAEAQRMAHLGNWELDLASNVLTWSDEIYRIFEIDPEKFGASYDAFLNGIHPDDRELVNQAYTDSVNNKKPYDIVHRLLMKDGRVKYVNEKCETYYGADGKPLRSVGAVHDITAQKVADIALSALKDDLEHRVRLRTAELEAANKELEAFSYSVSHDLRTPLRAIDGFSRILLDDYTDKLDDEGKRLLKVVRDNTSRMGQLIDDILKFSRAGRLEISYAEIDMARLAREVFEELRPDVTPDKLQLEIGPIRPATGDPAMMRQVWANLLSNAIKFSRPKEAARIRVGSFVEGDETVYFVEDNGVGFDMRYADKLFGVFQRLHGVDEFEGTGIGLAIVKRIATRHGGRVWAEGKVDQGATIYFALPNKEKEHG
ncbi:MAG: PAS domain S-box protein [Rhodoferax sp.]|uniref:PAS domain S-box protein n=1 Tax=Rhodoferax sp. TaxID=50421 RepID=UPI00262EF7BC|nr:PAS domain S-box protein [Rhodoferax sp.]MDD5332850.1 PAS domain S-box protein [Rhodoferax sp.]